MITCKEVARAAASGQLESMPWFRRLTVALHLSMCRHCSRFVRQLKLMRRASRQIHLETAPPSGEGLEARVLRRLTNHESSKSQ
jgi:hypothetical protein